MKFFILALLFTAIATQVPLSPSAVCWNTTCKNVWANYKAPARRLQGLVAVPEISNGDCQEVCYNRCMCAKHVAANGTTGRRLQAVEPTGMQCNKQCGGGGHRRLQGVVAWRRPQCNQLCFDDCYADNLGKRQGRRLQAILSKETLSRNACSTTCNISNPVVPTTMSRTCQTNCVCMRQ